MQTEIEVRNELISISKVLEQAPKTIFDNFAIEINRKNVGLALRDDLAETFNKFGRINELASHAEFQAKKAKTRKDKVFALAMAVVNKKTEGTRVNLETKKNMVKITSVLIDGETTNYIQEEERCALYEYLASRGKDIIKEISTMLDLGRSMLSFDKSEMTRNN